jgi:hypothetical protein
MGQNQELLRIFREKFNAEMQTKTGWGKNDVMAVFDRTSADAAVECLDNQADAGPEAE